MREKLKTLFGLWLLNKSKFLFFFYSFFLEMDRILHSIFNYTMSWQEKKKRGIGFEGVSFAAQKKKNYCFSNYNGAAFWVTAALECSYYDLWWSSANVSTSVMTNLEGGEKRGVIETGHWSGYCVHIVALFINKLK